MSYSYNMPTYSPISQYSNDGSTNSNDGSANSNDGSANSGFSRNHKADLADMNNNNVYRQYIEKPLKYDSDYV